MTNQKDLTITQKLLLIQSQLIAPKNQVNAFGKYKYRSCEDILEAVKPLLRELKAVLVIRDEVVLIGTRYYIKATATLVDEKNKDDQIETTAYAREPESKKGADESQITGAASSYARKYLLNGLFAIDDTKDADTKDNTYKGDGIYRITFGKHKGKRLDKMEREDLISYCKYLKDTSVKDKKELDKGAAELIEKAREFLTKK